MRLLGMLSDRFGAFAAIANSSIKLARVVPEEAPSLEGLLRSASWLPPASSTRVRLCR